MTNTEVSPVNFDPDEYMDRVGRLGPVIQDYITYFREQMVTEARAGNYDIRTRSSFLVAIGAQTRLMSPGFPEGGNVIVNGIAALSVPGESYLAVIEDNDPDMPFWDAQEWSAAVKQAAESALLRGESDGDEDRPALSEHSLDGYMKLLEGLRSGAIYFPETPLAVSGVDTSD